MSQKITALAALVSVALISILFLGMGASMAAEQERTERYILSAAGNAVHAVRNEILSLFENYAEAIRGIDSSGWDGDMDRLSLGEVHQLDDFPPIVRDSVFIGPEMMAGLSGEGELGREMPYFREFLDHLDDITLNKNLSLINIYKLTGYMAFPVKTGPEEDIPGEGK